MDIGRITLWRGQRTVHIREIDVSLQNISRVFKLVDSSIYLVAETGVVLLPSTTGYIGDIELGRKYEVCGDEAPLSSSSHLMTPPPPPPPNNNRFQFCARPVASASAGRPTPQRRAFSRSISIGRVEGGALVLDGATLFVEFTESEATVATISEKVKQDLQTDDNIILCDGQGNRLLEGGGTNGLAFWRQNARKIVALHQSAYNELMKRKKRRKSHMDVDDGCLEKLEELVLAADELPAITKALQDLGQCARSNRVNTVSLTNDQVSHTKEIFSCVVCKDVMRSPVVAPCCRSLLGCHVCIEEWSRNAQHCPKCRNETVWKTYFVVNGMEEVVGMLRNTIAQ